MSEFCTLENIDNLCKDISSWYDLYYMKEKIWDYRIQEEFAPNFDKYAGGTKGRLISYYPFGRFGGRNRKISLFDHRFIPAYNIELTGDIKNAYVYVATDDRVIAITVYESEVYCETFIKKRKCSSVLLKDLAADSIIDVSFWDTGCLILTNGDSNDTKNIFYLANFKTLKFYANLRSEAIHILTIPPNNTSDGNPIFYAWGLAEKIIIGNSSSVTEIPLPSTVTQFCISHNYENAALLLGNGKLIMLRSNFQEILNEDSDNDIGTNEIVYGMTFCGDLVLISKNENVEMWSYKGWVDNIEAYRIPLVFADDTNALIFDSEKLTRLTLVSEDLYRTAQKYPADISYNLLKAFIEQRGRVIDSMQVSGTLEPAIQRLIEATYSTSDARIQKTLVSAASYGLSFINNRTSDQLSNCIKNLRIANALKSMLNIIMPANDLNILPLQTAPMKFAYLEKFDIAIEVANYLMTEIPSIMTEWCAAVMEKFPNTEDAMKLIEKRKDESLFNAADIAKCAKQLGRHELSLKLALMETNQLRLVDFYIQNNDIHAALTTALASHDTLKFMKVLELAQTDKNIAKEFASEDSPNLAFIVQFAKKNPDAMMFFQNLAECSKDTSLPGFTDASLKNVYQKIFDDNPVALRKLAMNMTLKDKKMEGLEAELARFSQKAKDKESKTALIESASQMLENAVKHKTAAEGAVNDYGGDLKDMPLNKVIKTLVDQHGVKVAYDFATKKVKLENHMFTKSAIDEKVAQAIIVRSVFELNKLSLLPELARVCPDQRNLVVANLRIRKQENSIESYINSLQNENQKKELRDMLQDETKFSRSFLGEKQISSKILLK